MVSRKITQILIENHLDPLRKSYPVFEISKIEIKSEECAQEISSCFICFTQQMKVVINCGKSDILKGKLVVSLVKRFSNKFFQCLRSSPPASTRSLQLPLVLHTLFLENEVQINKINYRTMFFMSKQFSPFCTKAFNLKCNQHSSLGDQKFWFSHHNGDFISLHWGSIIVIFTDLMFF